MIISLLAMFLGAYAQEGVVSEVEVRGEQNIAESTIVAAMRTKQGQVYDPTVIARRPDLEGNCRGCRMAHGGEHRRLG